MPDVSSIVLVIDGLGASWLGPYGNTWLETPAFNRLAAESLLFEHVTSDSPSLEQVCRSYWSGRHALNPADGRSPISCLPAELAGWGLHTAVVSDELQVAEHPLAAGFQEHHSLPPLNIDQAASDAAGTQVGQLFAAAVDVARSLPGPFSLWVHAQGLAGMWDAPWQWRAQLADEEDPEPPDFVTPPAAQLSVDVDPDLVLGLLQSAAAQVALIDLCLETLINVARQRHCLLIVTSPRGYPLGEHLRVGLDRVALYSELVQAMMMVRWPDGRRGAFRSQRLVQPDAVHQLLRAWHGGDAEAACLSPPDSSELAVCAGEGELAVRTTGWFARLPDEETVELYVKPDDRGEVNEVSSLCRDEAAAMQALGWEAREHLRASPDHRLSQVPVPALLATD